MLVFLPLFLLLLMISLPVFFGLLFAPGFLLWLNGQERDLALLYRNVFNGIDSFPLMAIPFFMLAGEMMNRGGITGRLVEFMSIFCLRCCLPACPALPWPIRRHLVRCSFQQWKSRATHGVLRRPSRQPRQ